MEQPYNDIKVYFDKVSKRVSEGSSYLEVSRDFPLVTKALYKKLGGILRTQRFDNESPSNALVVGDSSYVPQEPIEIPDDLIRGTLLGDATIEVITESKYSNTALLRYSHCWQQISYCKALYELFKPLSSAVTIKSTSETNKDYVVQITTITSSLLYPYYNLFYEEVSEGVFKKNPFNISIIEGMTPRSLALWLMDDGSKYGSAPGVFEIVVSKQRHYGYEEACTFVSRLSDKLEIPLRCLENKIAYSICVLAKDRPIVEKTIAPYIIPDFNYKLGLQKSSCGSFYKDFDWYNTWDIEKRFLEHPHLLKYPYKSTYSIMDNTQKKKYLRCLYSRVKVRGFPYDTSDKEDLRLLWNILRNTSVKEERGKLTASPRANYLASHFFRHRYECHQNGRKSPEEIFESKKDLMRVLQIQLDSGPDISNTNIKNAICTYGTTALGQFNSAIARYLADKYSIGENVLDPCSGWGNRLSGVVASGRNYYGIEPSKKTYEGLLSLGEWLFDNVSKSIIISVVNGVAEERSSYPDIQMDFAITSPPYYDIEVYDKEESQSSVRYRTFQKWVDFFLEPMVENVYNFLRKGAVFALNIGDSRGYGFIDKSIKSMISAGFSIETESPYLLKTIRRPGMVKDYSEVVIIGRKVC